MTSRISLFPLTAEINTKGHLCLGGCDVTELVEEYDTPLYVFDEFTLRAKCREFKEEFTKRYSETLVIYASKAFLNPALALLFKEEGLGLDVVSGGELSIAAAVAFPQDRIYFHGNNKTIAELKLALELGVGRIVVDNMYELGLLDEIARERGIIQNILLRLNPGVDIKTHHYTTTGVLDSKFGFPLPTGEAEVAVARAISARHLSLLGFHFHLGSPIFEVSPFQKAIELVLHFAAKVKTKYGFSLREFSPGGGFAVQYTLDSPVPMVADYAEAITSQLIRLEKELGLPQFRLIVEPGRGIIGQAGVALYRVGATKSIPGVRKYVCVDGGIGDNIRPALYGARYEALVANRALEKETEVITIAGKFCESGDILVKDIPLPEVKAGDIIAIPVSGAYCLAMASNYNANPRPAIIMVSEGKSRLIRRRESYQDLMRLDVI